MINAIDHVCIPIPKLLFQFQKKAFKQVKAALKATGGNKTKAAEVLGMKRTTLLMYLTRHAPELLNYRFKKKK